MKFLIRLLGLKGSWKWAVRQMRKGYEVTFTDVTGTLRYRIYPNGRIVSTFDSPSNWSHHKGDYRWKSAVLHIRDFKKTNWCLVTDNKNLMEILQAIPNL